MYSDMSLKADTPYLDGDIGCLFALRSQIFGFWSHIQKMTSKCANVAPRVIFDEIDEDVDDTVFRQGLRTMSMLLIARSAVLIQHNFLTLFANFLLLLVRSLFVFHLVDLL